CVDEVTGQGDGIDARNRLFAVGTLGPNQLGTLASVFFVAIEDIPTDAPAHGGQSCLSWIQVGLNSIRCSGQRARRRRKRPKGALGNSPYHRFGHRAPFIWEQDETAR